MKTIQEIEYALVGAALTETPILLRTASLVKAAHFSSEKCATIWGAMTSMMATGQAVDLLTVAAHLTKAGKIEAVGGRVGLAELLMRTAKGDNAEHWAAIIRGEYTRREIGSAAMSAAMEASKDEADTRSIIQGIATTALNLLNEGSANKMATAGESIIEYLEDLQARLDAPEGMVGTGWGIRSLDRHTGGFEKGKLYILAARPGMGKTALALQAAKQSAKSGKPAVFYTLEMPKREVGGRLLLNESHVSAEQMKERRKPADVQSRIDAGILALQEMPLHIDDTAGLSATELLAKSMQLHHQTGGLGLIAVDYLQLMSGSGERGKSREQEVSEISRALKRLAMDLDVPVLALSQLSRAVETRGGDKRPMLSDLRESGSIEQDADMVIFLYRPEYYGITEREDGSPTNGLCEAIVAKFRGGETGIIDTACNLSQMRFFDYHGAPPPMQKPVPAHEVQSNRIAPAQEPFDFTSNAPF